eukprot:793946-Prorocentrum_minimum.AAC.5
MGPPAPLPPPPPPVHCAAPRYSAPIPLVVTTRDFDSFFFDVGTTFFTCRASDRGRTRLFAGALVHSWRRTARTGSCATGEGPPGLDPAQVGRAGGGAGKQRVHTPGEVVPLPGHHPPGGAGARAQHRAHGRAPVGLPLPQVKGAPPKIESRLSNGSDSEIATIN